MLYRIVVESAVFYRRALRHRYKVRAKAAWYRSVDNQMVMHLGRTGYDAPVVGKAVLKTVLNELKMNELRL